MVRGSVFVLVSLKHIQNNIVRKIALLLPFHCFIIDQEAPMPQEPKLRRATGIPQSFLTHLAGPAGRIPVPGAMITPTGHIAFATLDQYVDHVLPRSQSEYTIQK